MNETVKTIALISIGILLIAGTVTVVALRNYTDNKSVETPFTVAVEDNDTFRKDFNSGCIDEGGTYASCDCMYTSILKELGIDKLIEESVDYYNSNVFSPRMEVAVDNAVNSCYLK